MVGGGAQRMVVAGSRDAQEAEPQAGGLGDSREWERLAVLANALARRTEPYMT